MISFPISDVVNLCKQYGAELDVPTTLNGARLMLAIAAVESGGANPAFAGHDCGPRHESSFDVNGYYWRSNPLQRALVERYGADAASSFGPWQMMYPNFSDGATPAQLNSDLTLCAQEFVRMYNRENRRWDFILLAQIGKVWNTGRETRDPDYVTKLARAYELTVDVL